MCLHIYICVYVNTHIPISTSIYIYVAESWKNIQVEFPAPRGPYNNSPSILGSIISIVRPPDFGNLPYARTHKSLVTLATTMYMLMSLA